MLRDLNFPNAMRLKENVLVKIVLKYIRLNHIACVSCQHI